MPWVLNRLRGFASNPRALVVLESAERFILTFALMEKLIRRALTELIQIRDGQLTQQDIDERQRAITWGNIDGRWRQNDPQHRTLTVVLGGNGEFTQLQTWARMRNGLMHGSVQRYGQEYERELRNMVAMIEHIRDRFQAEYRYFGWRNSQFG